MKVTTKLFLSLLLTVTFSSALFGQLRKPEEEPFVPGELIVQIDPNVDLYKIVESVPAQFGFKVMQELSPCMHA